jgi:hypothetical protein
MRDALRPLTAPSANGATQQVTQFEPRCTFASGVEMCRLMRMVLAFSHILVLPVLAASCGSGTEPAPKATSLALVTAPSALAETMSPLGTQPIVQTVDASGAAVPTTATVTAEVLSGSGAVTEGGSVTTDANGRAAFSKLTLGGVWGQVGRVTLRFTSPGLEPVLSDVDLRCAAVRPLAIGQTVNGTLTYGDCTFGSVAVRNTAFRNIFEITASQSLTAVQLTTDFALVVKGPNELDHYFGWVDPSGDRISFKALLSRGPIRVAVTAIVLGDPLGGGGTISLGPYSLTAAAATEDLTCDRLDAVATSPITTSQKLDLGDCVSGGFLEDRLMVDLPPNATLSVSMTTSAFQPRLRLTDGNSNELLAAATAIGSASLTFANGSTGKGYRLLLSSQASGSSGSYTLSINIAYPPSSAATNVISPLSLLTNKSIARNAAHVSRP